MHTEKGAAEHCCRTAPGVNNRSLASDLRVQRYELFTRRRDRLPSCACAHHSTRRCRLSREHGDDSVEEKSFLHQFVFLQRHLQLAVGCTLSGRCAASCSCRQQYSAVSVRCGNRVPDFQMGADGSSYCSRLHHRNQAHEVLKTELGTHGMKVDQKEGFSYEVLLRLYACSAYTVAYTL